MRINKIICSIGGMTISPDTAALDTVGKRLRYVLKLRKFSQTKLAKRIGVSPQAVQAVCSDEVEKSRYLYDFAKILNIRPDWLETGQDPMEYKKSPTGMGPNDLLTNRQLRKIPIAWILSFNQKGGLTMMEPKETQYAAASADVGDAYAYKINGNFLANRIQDGETLIVSREYPITNGDEVFLRLLDGTIMILKYLFDQNGIVKFCELNKLDQWVSINKNDIDEMLLIIGIDLSTKRG